MRITRKKQAGYILVTGSVTAIVLFAFMGLAVDAGYMEWTKRRMQAAADAAAMGAALELQAGSGNQVTQGQNDAGLNGFTNGTNHVTVTINVPPTSGAYSGNSNTAEAIISQDVSTYFMGVLGFNTVTVKARAVGAPGSGTGCVYALDKTASKSLVASGSAVINTQCGIVVDSSNSDALDTSGSACIAGTSIAVVGNYSDSSSGSSPCLSGHGTSPTPKVDQKSVSDPLASISAPTFSATCDHTGWHNVTTTLNPGVYCNGITVSGGYTVTFNSGTYILLGGGLNISGGSNATGSGVTFYNTGNATYAYKPIVISGTSSTTLSAPTSGSLTGMLFFQDRSFTNTSQNTVSGGSATKFEGALYFPSTPLVYSGGSTAAHAAYTIIVADTITFSGGSYLNNDYSPLNGGSPIKSGAVLGE